MPRQNPHFPKPNSKTIAALVLLNILVSFQAMAEETAPIANNIEKISRGLLMEYNGKKVFSPCRERTYVQIEDNSPNAIASEQLKALGLADGKPLYVEFFGKPENGKLVISWVNFAHTNARCQPSANLEEQWRAIGETPRWLLRVSEKQMSLMQEGQTDYQHQAIEISAPAIGHIELTSTEKNNSDEQWIFEHQFCRSSDPSMLFGWKAEQRLGGKPSLKGCAWQGF